MRTLRALVVAAAFGSSLADAASAQMVLLDQTREAVAQVQGSGQCYLDCPEPPPPGIPFFYSTTVVDAAPDLGPFSGHASASQADLPSGCLFCSVTAEATQLSTLTPWRIDFSADLSVQALGFGSSLVIVTSSGAPSSRAEVAFRLERPGSFRLAGEFRAQYLDNQGPAEAFSRAIVWRGPPHFPEGYPVLYQERGCPGTCAPQPFVEEALLAPGDYTLELIVWSDASAGGSLIDTESVEHEAALDASLELLEPVPALPGWGLAAVVGALCGVALVASRTLGRRSSWGRFAAASSDSGSSSTVKGSRRRSGRTRA
jgi:hypothetical protein